MRSLCRAQCACRFPVRLKRHNADLCQPLFDWAPFPSTKAAIKLHTPLDLRGTIPAFIHVSDGQVDDPTVLDSLRTDG